MKPLRRFLADEAGTASIEFLFVFPIIFTIFTASFESSMFMARYVMLERSVDLVVRDIRLGLMDGVSHVTLKQKICQTGLLIKSTDECVKSMQIWMQPISTADFDMVAPPAYCMDRSKDIETQVPTGSDFAFGSDNEIMLMRICLKQYPMFASSAVTVQMPLDPVDNNYRMIVTSVFVNEPG